MSSLKDYIAKSGVENEPLFQCLQISHEELTAQQSAHARALSDQFQTLKPQKPSALMVGALLGSIVVNVGLAVALMLTVKGNATDVDTAREMRAAISEARQLTAQLESANSRVDNSLTAAESSAKRVQDSADVMKEVSLRLLSPTPTTKQTPPQTEGQ